MPQRGGRGAVASARVHLAAAGLLPREGNLVPKTFEDGDRRSRRFRKQLATRASKARSSA